MEMGILVDRDTDIPIMSSSLYDDLSTEIRTLVDYLVDVNREG
jgi:hypothetical protein